MSTFNPSHENKTDVSMNEKQLAEKLSQYRISASEYELICKLLGRSPRPIEWALFSALWSEHCSYKSSKVHLRKFSYRNNSVMESEGENAGVIDLGFGEKIAFKMESHNHPSFIEPFQGAATGVGGILRDIFTMGARPIAIADYLCFGDINAPRMKSLVKGVVSGISHYGNCVGVPTVTGQTEFDPAYNQNILVNAMAVGLMTYEEKMALSKAKGPGNLVVYVGSRTGVDGVHGASMASESFGDDLSKKKPNVQIGDPFYEKLLIESCLEVLKLDLVVAMQDMGAAGLTSSSFEMASKGQVGFDIHLDKVPMRNEGMTAEEVLLSESQERMLLVCEPSHFERLQSVFHKWGLEASVVGEVKSERVVRLYWNNDLLTALDPDLLVENAPRYERPYDEIKIAFPKMKAESVNELAKHKTSKDVLKILKSDIRQASKKFIYQQYDQRVGLRTMRDANQSVAVVRLPSKRSLGIAVGCRPSLMKVNAKLGAYDSVFYPALQMAVKGIKIRAITDCLNFGNPELPSVMSDFVASVEAIAEAAKLLDAPVVSGNVSFYNESRTAQRPQNIIPTPATGMIGLRESMDGIPWDQFKSENESVWSLHLPMVQFDLEKTECFGIFIPKSASEFVLGMVNLLNEVSVSASKVVGAAGLLNTLRQMQSEGYGLSEQFYSEKRNWAHSNLYQVIISVPEVENEKLQEALKSNFANLGLQVVKLGSTEKFSEEKSKLDQTWPDLESFL